MKFKIHSLKEFSFKVVTIEEIAGLVVKTGTKGSTMRENQHPTSQLQTINNKCGTQQKINPPA